MFEHTGDKSVLEESQNITSKAISSTKRCSSKFTSQKYEANSLK